MHAASASTQNQALSALLFVFKAAGVPVDGRIDAVRAKSIERVPVVLSRGETERLLEGMRVLECCRLRIKGVDFERCQVIVRDEKGGKDRVVMLPDALWEGMLEHRTRIRQLWNQDRRDGVNGVWMPPAPARKLPNAPASWK